MNALGNKLVVFGGGAMIDSSNVFLNETLLFDIGMHNSQHPTILNILQHLNGGVWCTLVV